MTSPFILNKVCKDERQKVQSRDNEGSINHCLSSIHVHAYADRKFPMGNGDNYLF